MEGLENVIHDSLWGVEKEGREYGHQYDGFTVMWGDDLGCYEDHNQAPSYG